jgi:hypothetical protein
MMNIRVLKDLEMVYDLKLLRFINAVKVLMQLAGSRWNVLPMFWELHSLQHPGLMVEVHFVFGLLGFWTLAIVSYSVPD